MTLNEKDEQIRSELAKLPEGMPGLTLVCPLCSAEVPARGLRAKPLHGQDNAQWQILFTCPACGLVTVFDANRTTAREIRRMRGSTWAAELREFRTAPQIEAISYLP